MNRLNCFAHVWKQRVVRQGLQGRLERACERGGEATSRRLLSVFPFSRGRFRPYFHVCRLHHLAHVVYTKVWGQSVPSCSITAGMALLTSAPASALARRRRVQRVFVCVAAIFCVFLQRSIVFRMCAKFWVHQTTGNPPKHAGNVSCTSASVLKGCLVSDHAMTFCAFRGV